MRTIRAMLALALALAGGGSFAQAVNVSDSAFQRFLISSTGVGQQTIVFTGSGQPVPQLSGHALAPDGTPNLKASGTGILRNGSGGQIPVSVTGRVTPQVLASFIKRAVPALSVLAVGGAIYDFAKESGYTLSRDPASGALIVTKSDPNVCSAAPCYGNTQIGFYSNAIAACRAYAVFFASGRTVTEAYGAEFTASNFRCYYRYGTGALLSQLLGISSATPAPVPGSPSSLAEFETYILQGNPYPLTSSAAEAIVQARDILKEEIPLTQPQISGPSTSQGDTKTTTKADGSTVTVTQTYNHTYIGPTINTTTTTVTSTIPAGGGPVQTETSVESPKVEEQPFVMPCGVAGTPACAVKVNEEGVPTSVEDLADPQQRVDETLQPLADLQADPIGFWPELPELTWNFALPTNCDVIPVPVFEEWMPPIDLCQFQPMFHSLMSVVWVLGGLFGAISLFWRNTLSTV